ADHVELYPIEREHEVGASGHGEVRALAAIAVEQGDPHSDRRRRAQPGVPGGRAHQLLEAGAAAWLEPPDRPAALAGDARQPRLRVQRPRPPHGLQERDVLVAVAVGEALLQVDPALLGVLKHLALLALPPP